MRPAQVVADQRRVDAQRLRRGGEVERAEHLVGQPERHRQRQRPAGVLHRPHAVGEVHRPGLLRPHVDAVGRPVYPLLELALAVVPHLAVDDGVPEADRVPPRVALRADRRSPDHDVLEDRRVVQLHLDHRAAGVAEDPGLVQVQPVGVPALHRHGERVEHRRLRLAQAGQRTLVDDVGVEHVGHLRCSFRVHSIQPRCPRRCGRRWARMRTRRRLSPGTGPRAGEGVAAWWLTSGWSSRTGAGGWRSCTRRCAPRPTRSRATRGGGTAGTRCSGPTRRARSGRTTRCAGPACRTGPTTPPCASSCRCSPHPNRSACACPPTGTASRPWCWPAGSSCPNRWPPPSTSGGWTSTPAACSSRCATAPRAPPATAGGATRWIPPRAPTSAAAPARWSSTSTSSATCPAATTPPGSARSPRRETPSPHRSTRASGCSGDGAGWRRRDPAPCTTRRRSPANLVRVQRAYRAKMWVNSHVVWARPEQLSLARPPGQLPLSRCSAQNDSSASPMFRAHRWMVRALSRVKISGGPKSSTPIISVTPVMAHIFFFQAEDGIRDATVTGVQTCAIPIYNDDLVEIKRRRVLAVPTRQHGHQKKDRKSVAEGKSVQFAGHGKNNKNNC